ncbi:MAG: spermidine/putrescine transport system substrate-binding protein [Actinomycetota bacterium]|nr:spermidine/putrescine transport system substrate-binding protein [Actinomycetota bacterium]
MNPDEQMHLSKAMNRRSFLQRSAALGVAIPSAAAILAACSKPGTGSPVPSGSRNPLEVPPSPKNPVKWPLYGQAIADDTPIETNVTLQVYNWGYYLWPALFRRFEDQYKKYNVKVELTTFNNEEEAVQKLKSGAIKPDVTFPTVYVVGQQIVSELLQPLNHNLVPNMAANCWDQFQNPWYDQEWQYTVPYVVWTTGIGYRRDHIDDALATSSQYDLLWNPKYKGKVAFYDTEQNAIAMSLLKNGYTDVNTGDAEAIGVAKDDLIKLVTDSNARIANDDYSTVPADQIWTTQSWSGDIVAAKFYLPKGTSEDVLGYWYPPEGGGVVGNDMLAIPASAEHPRLAHEFLNFMLDATNAFDNFTNYTGYQPPQKTLDPTSLVPDVVPAGLAAAVVSEANVTDGQYLTSLTPDVNALWAKAWDEIKAGAG